MAPTITAREFLTLINGAAHSAFSSKDGLTAAYPAAASLQHRPRHAVAGLRRVIVQEPCDPVAHRLLGVAYLHTGELRLAARHLGIAFDLLRHQSAPPVAAHIALPAQLQIAALRLLLATFLSTVGDHKLASRILLDGVEP